MSDHASRTETFQIERSLPDGRLDNFLKDRYPAVTRGTIQRLIEEGHITINEKMVKQNHKPKAGDTVSVYWPEPKPAEAKPEAIALDVLFEDSDIIVLNKPAGLVVHPAAGHEDHTLVNALLHHCKGQLSGIGGVARPGIVHRLDKDTSGCIIAAKTDQAHQGLASQFAERELSKIYLALLIGVMTEPKGVIRASITRHPTHRKQMTVQNSGREAHTSFVVLERMTTVTLVEATLHTGRTHQIRVHFKHVGYPLAGDIVYGSKPNIRLQEQTGIVIPRQMLHAKTLEITHPLTGRKMKFEAPLPQDFEDILTSFRKWKGKTGLKK
ncbi:MAG: Pseudouridine synthase [Verrucomicrobiales bacterium]|nr:Pseudouridine synthase [Verrucomicrobiales bacterium]